MISNDTKTLEHLFFECTGKYNTLPVNTMVGASKFQTYSELREKADALSRVLSQHGVGYGDKVAILSAGHPNWIAAFFSAVAYGRVAVTLLPDFSPSVVNNVLGHSGSKALFVSTKCVEKLDSETVAGLDLVINIETLEIVSERETAPVKSLKSPNPQDLAVLIYTSGTTGNAKGVMLSHHNFVTTVRNAYSVFVIGTDDSMLSSLPLAHAYELSLGLLYPFSAGTCVYYLPKAPSPAVLTHALKVVRPTAMLVVPLIIEKVYKGAVVPRVKGSKMLRILDKICHPLLCRLVGKGMIRSFGGRIRFIGIGGAKLDENVEKFLKTAHFPYVIGYGLTECCPLLSVAYGNSVPKVGSIGKPIQGIKMRLDNVNPQTGQGEIVATGDVIMQGYYNNPEKTAEVFTSDGWFRTGDVGEMDKKGNFYIKGRIGNMIVGPSGENIYPEDVEKVIMELPDVEECIVIPRKGRLVGLVKLVDGIIDIANADSPSVRKSVETQRAQMLSYVNGRVNASAKLGSIEFMTEAFDKTATRKIRRFVYKDSAPTI